MQPFHPFSMGNQTLVVNIQHLFCYMLFSLNVDIFSVFYYDINIKIERFFSL